MSKSEPSWVSLSDKSSLLKFTSSEIIYCELFKISSRVLALFLRKVKELFILSFLFKEKEQSKLVDPISTGMKYVGA